MLRPVEQTEAYKRPNFIRAPQDLGGGIILLALAALAIWLTRDLSQGTLSTMGPAMLPRWLAVGVGLCGLALVISSFFKDGEMLVRWSLRGPLFVTLGILIFAVTIRPFSVGPLTLPGLGLLVAGPLTIIIGGFATPEARLKDLVILALSLTPFCMLLFGDFLNLAIPIFPQALMSLFPVEWSQKMLLRVTAAILIVAAAAVHFAGRSSRRPVGIADHDGRI
jgi:hypothetical protein